jgi:hypothetical protein
MYLSLHPLCCFEGVVIVGVGEDSASEQQTALDMVS